MIEDILWTFQQGTEKSGTSPNRKMNKIEIGIRIEKELHAFSNLFSWKNSRNEAFACLWMDEETHVCSAKQLSLYWSPVEVKNLWGIIAGFE